MTDSTNVGKRAAHEDKLGQKTAEENVNACPLHVVVGLAHEQPHHAASTLDVQSVLFTSWCSNRSPPSLDFAIDGHGPYLLLLLLWHPYVRVRSGSMAGVRP